MSTPVQPILVLVGPPGAGKTTVGRSVAEALGASFVDTDEMVAQEAGQEVSDIFLDRGEEGFRALEEDVVARALTADGVVALGSGAVERAGTRHALARLTVAFLDVSMSAGVPRAGLDAPRPLLVGSPRSTYRSLAAARRPLYEECATWTVDTSELSVAEVSEQLVRALHQLSQGTDLDSCDSSL